MRRTIGILNALLATCAVMLLALAALSSSATFFAVPLAVCCGLYGWSLLAQSCRVPDAARALSRVDERWMATELAAEREDLTLRRDAD